MPEDFSPGPGRVSTHASAASDARYYPGFKNRAILWACPETLVQSPDVHPRTGQSGFPGSLGLR